METDAREKDALSEVDVEKFANENPADCAKPHARIYIIRVDRKTIRVPHPELTGKQILRLVEKSPETHKLFQKFKGSEAKEVAPDEVASFVRPGVERFMTIPCDTTEGSPVADLRREFVLPAEDAAFLDEMGLAWEAIMVGDAMWLVVHEYPVPNGYQVNSTSVALQLAATYPEAQLDMAYFFPSLSRTDGAPIKRITNHSLDGKVWQRWSRHRTAQNPWRPGVDGLETHLLLVSEWLAREMRTHA